MYVLRPAGGAQPAERRLAALMWCFEQGARVVGPDFAALPPPHEAWPAVVVPPATSRGHAVTVAFRPVFGYVFYTEHEGLSLEELTRALAGYLPTNNVSTTQTASASFTTTHEDRGTIILNKHDRVTVVANGRPGHRQRRFARCIDVDGCNNVQAGFVWRLRPVTWLLERIAACTAGDAREDDSSGNEDAELRKMLVSSILYDAADLLRLDDGATVSTLSLSDFKVSLQLAVPGTLIVDGGRLTFAGNVALPWVWRPVDGLAEAPPPPATRCLTCAAPVGGVAVVFSLQPSGPESPIRHNWRLKTQLLCLRCWGGAGELLATLGAEVSRVRLPLSQAQQCAATPGFEHLASLLEGTVTCADGLSGGFILEQEGHPSCLLVGSSRGMFAALSADCRAFRLPVKAGLSLAVLE